MRHAERAKRRVATERIDRNRRQQPRPVPTPASGPARLRPRRSARVAALLGILLVAALFHVWSRLAVVERGYRLAAARATHAHLLEQNRRLRLEVATLTAPARLTAAARARLGLVPPSPDQIVHLEPTLANPTGPLRQTLGEDPASAPHGAWRVRGGPAQDLSAGVPGDRRSRPHTQLSEGRAWPGLSAGERGDGRSRPPEIELSEAPAAPGPSAGERGERRSRPPADE